MKELVLLIFVISTFIISLIVGLFLYKLENKKNFNFLNVFPFEMENKDNTKLTLLFRIILSIFIGISCVDILYLFIFHFDSNINSKILGSILILDCLMLLGIFIINTNLYKGYVLVSSSFLVFNCVSYFIFGHNLIVSEAKMWMIILVLSIGICQLLILLLPMFKNWFRLEKVDEGYKRKKVNILVLTQWINIILFICLLIIKTILYV